jgi:hypothetical membrane protein
MSEVAMRFGKLLLIAGVLAPLCYFAVLGTGTLYYPGYNHVTQYASELGSAASAHPEIFNYGVITAGALAVISSLGFGLALGRISKGFVAAGLTALAVAAWGAGMIMGGMFPMPDERHGGYGVILLSHIGPLTAAWALWRAKGMGLLKTYLLVDFLAMVALFAIMMGVGQLVHRADVGLWQRAYALVMIPWIGILAAALIRRREPAAPAEAALAA